MDVHQRYRENLKKFVLSNPDLKNRGNIDEKKNKEEFKKLGNSIDAIVQLMRYQSPEAREKAEMKIEEVMGNIDSFFRYAMQEQLRFNQKDREEIKHQMDGIRQSLDTLRQISPNYARRIDDHIRTINEMYSKSGGVRKYSSDEGIYTTGSSINDSDYVPSLPFRINNQMYLKRNNNYLPTKFGFNEPDTM